MIHDHMTNIGVNFVKIGTSSWIPNSLVDIICTHICCWLWFECLTSASCLSIGYESYFRGPFDMIADYFREVNGTLETILLVLICFVDTIYTNMCYRMLFECLADFSCASIAFNLYSAAPLEMAAPTTFTNSMASSKRFDDSPFVLLTLYVLIYATGCCLDVLHAFLACQ